MSRLDELKKELTHLDKITLFYPKGQADWIYFNGEFELPEKIIKNKNGMYEKNSEGDCVAIMPSDSFIRWERVNWL